VGFSNSYGPYKVSLSIGAGNGEARNVDGSLTRTYWGYSNIVNRLDLPQETGCMEGEIIKKPST
jgi:hypothetical protein